MRSQRLHRRLAALALGVYLFAIVCGPAAAATTTPTTSSSTAATSTAAKNPSTSSGSRWVGVAQTVVVATSATGKVSGTPRVFTQFSANGSGPATLKVPMSSSGFRNLSGLGKPPIQGGYAVWNLQLAGPTSQRSIAHFASGKLPLQVSAAYELNGKKVKASHIVGKSGELKVTYVITNPTTKSTTVSFKNVLGSKETSTVKAPLPIAADLNVTVPAQFTNLKAPGASANGNGNGTSTAAWTLFLFDPLGGVKQSITYQAHVTNAIVPAATLEAEVLPPTTIKPLPAISEPGPPAVPVVTLGGRLASYQVKLQADLAKLSGKASTALNAFKKAAVPAVQAVSRGAANLAGRLPGISAAAKAASINAVNASTSLGQASAAAANDSTTVASNVQSGLSQAAAGAADASTRMAGSVQSGLQKGAAGAADASAGAGDVRSGLSQAAAEATDASKRMSDLQSGLNQASAEAADASKRIAGIQTGLQALPASTQATPEYAALHAQVVDLEALLTTHAADLNAAAAKAGDLGSRLTAHASGLNATAAKAEGLGNRLSALSDQLTQTSSAAASDLSARLTALSGLLARTSSTASNVLGARLTALSGLLARTSTAVSQSLAPDAATASTKLAGLIPTANSVSTKAAATATTLAGATLPGRKRPPRAIQPKQIGGGAHLDKAFGELDGAITDAANKVDHAYAYLTALDKRAAGNQLPAGNAIGATVEAGAFVYSIAGANDVAHQTHLAAFIGGFALVIGLTVGIGLYRIRRGMPSSLAPPKSSAAAA